MQAASEYSYQLLNGTRTLGPPHQRFPEMHPEKGRWEKHTNPVFLELPSASGSGCLSGVAGMFLHCMLLGLGTAYYATYDTGNWRASYFWIPFLMFGVPAIAALVFAAWVRPVPPLRLNRITQELIMSDGTSVVRLPWAQIPVRICKTFDGRGGSSSYALQFDFGETPKQMLWSDVGGGTRFEETALRDWEFFRRYMESPDGHVETRKLTKEEKTAERRGWEALNDLSIYYVVGFPLAPAFLFTYIIMSLMKFRKPLPWPQEVLDICENHPLYQQWLRNKKGKGRWAKA